MLPLLNLCMASANALPSLACLQNADQNRKIEDLNDQITALRKENCELFKQNSKLMQHNMLINEDLRMCLTSSNSCIHGMQRPAKSHHLSLAECLPTLEGEVSHE